MVKRLGIGRRGVAHSAFTLIELVEAMLGL